MLALLAVLAMPAPLSGQAPEQRIEAAMTTASAAGIPVGLLQGKVEEGKAKGIPMEMIAAAVERRAAALTRARAAMGDAAGGPSEADLAAGADALGAGIADAILGVLAESAPGEYRALAITALTELVALGRAPEQALLQVTEALARGPESVSGLTGVAAREAAPGRGPQGAGPPGHVRSGGPPPPGPPPLPGNSQRRGHPGGE
jgi:hypothetical protein